MGSSLTASLSRQHVRGLRAAILVALVCCAPSSFADSGGAGLTGESASGGASASGTAAFSAAVRSRKRGAGAHSRIFDPITGFTIDRDDMGVDASAQREAAIVAPADSTLSQVMQDWYDGEPLLLFHFVHHLPGALSDYWYVAEQINPVTTRTGAFFRAGGRVASYASSGTGLEIGWGSPTSNSRTLAEANDPGSANPPGGATTRWGESFKHFFGIH